MLHSTDKLKLTLVLLVIICGVTPGAALADVSSSPTNTQPILRSPGRFQSTVGKHGMVAAGEKLAVLEGLKILKNGGNAVDAAVATAFVLAVTLPRAGNLGGGGFMLIRKPDGTVLALDFRETAPAAADRDMYLNATGKVDRDKATLGALAVGVPGTVAGLLSALDKYGTMQRNQVMAPAIKLAAHGFRVSPWLADGLRRASPRLSQFPETKAIFLPGGKPPEIGSILRQPDLAETLHLIAKHGKDGFYSGDVARKIVESIHKHGGIMSYEDLHHYRVKWRSPVRGTYRGYTVYSMPPPSSGGVHLIQMLNILEGYNLRSMGHNSARYLHVLAEAMRSAYADRSRWLGDPDFYSVPVSWLTSKRYAAQLRAQIPLNRSRRSDNVLPGHPPQHESQNTTHLCVVDDKGWAVSLTYTLNFSYGSGLVAAGTGVLLNNEMDDFSAAPGVPNAFGLIGGEANSIQPHKRPLSSMTPTIIEKDGHFVAAVGSPGGSRIITTVLQVVLNILDFHYNALESVALPRIHHQWYPDKLFLEEGISPDTIAILKSMGHNVTCGPVLGHAELILKRPDGILEGGSDPRRDGAALGY